MTSGMIKILFGLSAICLLTNCKKEEPDEVDIEMISIQHIENEVICCFRVLINEQSQANLDAGIYWSTTNTQSAGNYTM
ncbi:MAG: hypothetical protein IPM77_11365 [Crocinitomicaceae bacterium]|nr:hypothetical protein [Crocinitomicaceae bacterium]